MQLAAKSIRASSLQHGTQTMLVKKGQNIKMCYLHNKNDIHISSGSTCASRL